MSNEAITVQVRDRRIELHPVASSNVERIGFDEAMRVLVVTYRLPAPRKGQNVIYETGRMYVYTPVSFDTWTALMLAESKGAYLRQHIIGNHEIKCERMELVAA